MAGGGKGSESALVAFEMYQEERTLRHPACACHTACLGAAAVLRFPSSRLLVRTHRPLGVFMQVPMRLSCARLICACSLVCFHMRVEEARECGETGCHEVLCCGRRKAWESVERVGGGACCLVWYWYLTAARACEGAPRHCRLSFELYLGIGFGSQDLQP